MAAPADQHRTYSFGEFTLDVDRGTLIRNGTDVQLRPQSFRVLRLLVEGHGSLLTRNDLVQRVWGDTAVTDDSLTQCVIDIRKAIGDTDHTKIRTVPRRGYLFDLPVEHSDAASAPRFEAGSAPPISVAVLPFCNLSPDPDQDYFCEGMAEEIINVLSGIAGLKVTARASAFRFRGKAKNLNDVGRALNVSTVLDGSVRTAASRLRVTAQLTSVDSGYQIWTQRYDTEMEDVFAVQDRIAASIARALHIQLIAPQRRGSDRRATESLDAYHLCLKGHYNWYQREEGALLKAARLFEQAAVLDPDYAEAQIGIAISYSGLTVYAMDPRIARSRIQRALERALALAPDNSRLWAAMGYAGIFTSWEWQKANQALERAIDLDPTAVRPYCWQAFLHGILGRFDEAVAAGRRAVALDPLSSYAHGCLGQALICAERDEEAIEIVEEARELDPDYLFNMYILGQAYAGSGRHDDAVEVLELAARRSGRNIFYSSWLGWALGLAGRRTEAEQILDELAAKRQHQYVVPVSEVNVFCGLGDYDKVFEWLDRVVAHQTWFFPSIAAYRPLRGDARFRQVLDAMGLPVLPYI